MRKIAVSFVDVGSMVDGKCRSALLGRPCMRCPQCNASPKQLNNVDALLKLPIDGSKTIWYNINEAHAILLLVRTCLKRERACVCIWHTAYQIQFELTLSSTMVDRKGRGEMGLWDLIGRDTFDKRMTDVGQSNRRTNLPSVETHHIRCNIVKNFSLHKNIFSDAVYWAISITHAYLRFVAYILNLAYRLGLNVWKVE